MSHIRTILHSVIQHIKKQLVTEQISFSTYQSGYEAYTFHILWIALPISSSMWSNLASSWTQEDVPVWNDQEVQGFDELVKRSHLLFCREHIQQQLSILSKNTFF